MEEVSLIITTRDRPEDVRRSLRSVMANIDNLGEVIIVDQSKDNQTKEVVAEHGCHPKVRYMRCWATGLSIGRNIGVSVSVMPLIGFTDDDCILPHNWTLGIADELRQPRVGAFFGAVVAEPFDWRTGHTPSVPDPPTRTIRVAEPREIPGIMGANMAFRREALAAIGGFDPFLGAGAALKSAEEVDAAYRVLLAGYQVVLRPNPTVTHFGFRTYASGASRAVVLATCLGMAGYYGKHIRTGDLRAALAYLCYVTATAREVLKNLRQGRRPLGVNRILYAMFGLVQSFRYRVDRPRRMYVAPRAAKIPRGTRTG